MTSWNWYIEHFLEKEHPLEWQKDILNQIKEREEKKGKPKMEKEVMRTRKIPGQLKLMEGSFVSPNAELTFPTFEAEIYPQSLNDIQALYDYMVHDGSFSFEFWYKGAIGLVMKSNETLTPERIIHSGPATIVFWNDKTKTVVKCSENDIYDEYEAFCAALAIKMFGSNSHLKKMIRDKTEEMTPKKESEVKVKCEDSSLQEAINKIKKAIGVE